MVNIIRWGLQMQVKVEKSTLDLDSDLEKRIAIFNTKYKDGDEDQVF